MKEVFSKGKDCKWLALQLKDQMGEYVSFNEYGIDNPILTGVYDKDGIGGPYYSRESVRFYIKFCKENFLRIQIEIHNDNNENKMNAMIELIQALSTIKQEEKTIGFPLAIYKVDDLLTCEYSFKNPEFVIEDLKNNTMFDDGCIENLRFLGTCNDCSYGSYTIDSISGNEVLYCTNGNCARKTQENNTCIDHKFEDGERPNIKLLCNSICNNN